ncbi:hypothetical protein SDC9_157818 [bioreactor metagenome]|uniref:Uncharacterized protein n=1 Tax=bioreactor metagenome TaxID=1076179 RepID=A0A645FDQ5_9ZZZZ
MWFCRMKIMPPQKNGEDRQHHYGKDNILCLDGEGSADKGEHQHCKQDYRAHYPDIVQGSLHSHKPQEYLCKTYQVKAHAK